MPAFERKSFKFKCRGIQWSRPLDSLDEGKFLRLDNIRTYRDGEIQTRNGYTPFYTSPNYVHSLSRLNDSRPAAPAAFTRVGGAGTSIVVGASALASGIFNNQSGNPLSFVEDTPVDSDQPYKYVSDNNPTLAVNNLTRTMAKVAVDGTMLHIGIAPPSGTYPTVANPGTAGLLIGDYQYRYTFYSTKTGIESNPSGVTPPVTAASQVLTITGFSSTTDAQVDRVRIYRNGGTLTTWRLVAETAFPTTWTDNLPDSAAIGQSTLRFDNNQPWTSTDITRSGTCTVAGTIVTWQSGDQFNPRWPDGTLIVIGGHTFTMNGHVLSLTLLAIVETPNPAIAGTVPFTITTPLLMGENIPLTWGPLVGGESNGGSYHFGCGDRNRPGVLLWTNGNNPDAASLANSLDVTGGSETLMNGCMFDGRAFVFSTKRMFSIYPSFSSAGQFNTQESAAARGLFARWALAVGPKIWFLAHDGIYETTGGEAVSITDADLYPFFLHEGTPARPIQIDEIGTLIQPPDFQQESNLRLLYFDGYLYFDYVEASTGLPRTLVYDTRTKSWFRDTYSYAAGDAAVHFPEVGKGIGLLFLGNSTHVGTDIAIYGANDDGGVSVVPILKSPYMDFGDSRPKKLWGDSILDDDASNAASNQLTYTIDGDFGRTAISNGTTAAATGRTQNILDIANGLGVLAKNVAITVTWSTHDGVSLQAPAIYEWQPSLVPKPIDTLKRATDYDEDGKPGAKYIRGVIIESDSSNLPRTVQLQHDGGIIGATVTVQAGAQLDLPFGFTPFVGTELRAVPTDANSWRLFKITWIWDPYPELAAISTAWQDAGSYGAKWLQGCRLKADTASQGVTAQIHGDEDVIQTSITINHNGQSIKAYNWTPFVTHMMRVQPLTAARIWDPIDWIWEPIPDLADQWITEGMTFGFQGFFWAKELWIAHMSVTDISVTLGYDGQSVSVTIPNSGSTLVYQKNRVQLPYNKGKQYSFQVTSSQKFRLFKKDCELRVKQWGAQGAFQTVNPFGDNHNESGARI